MHGKIVIYMDSTDRGTVTNSAKLFLNLTASRGATKEVCLVWVCL